MKADKQNSDTNHIPWGLIILVLLFPALMIPLSLVDFEWTVRLHTSGFKEFGDIVDRTLFDGDKPGASDPAILFQILNLGCYLMFARYRDKPLLNRLRPGFGFVFFCSLFTGLGLVHSLKWVIGRARPYLVLDGTFNFSHWYQFGPQFVTDGIFYGSFPSGHTATVFLLMTLAYLLAGDTTRTLKTRIAGWFLGLGVLVYSLCMIIGRAITLDHWLTDSVGITLLSWIFIHLIFFYILKIPAQIRYVQDRGLYAPLPWYWEVKLLWHLLLMTLGVMSLLIGSHAVMIGKSPWLVAIVIPGGILLYRSQKNLIREYRSSMTYFQPYADQSVQ